MDENRIVHLLNQSTQTNSLASTFMRILERVVGADYYAYLYLSFSSLESLKTKNSLLREKIKQNNVHLENYQENVDSLKLKLNKIKKDKLKEIESLIDIKYNENLNEKVEELKTEINSVLDDLTKANSALLPSENLEKEINEIKAEIKEIMLDIKFAYDGLRSLKTLKIFQISTKNEIKIKFLKELNASNNSKYESAFEKLWDLAINEASGLNKIANMAKQISLKYPTGFEEFNPQDSKKIDLALNEYDTKFSLLTKVSDFELLN